MATTPKTVRTYALDGTKKDFTIPFEYLARKFVTVTLIGTTRKELVLITDYRFTTSTQITTNKAWGPGDGYEMIEIRRLTSATDRLVDFADGSILRAYDLNISQVQSLHIAEEARDLTADTIAVNNNGQLDARGRQIVNLADAVLPGDAVTLRQEQAWSASALNQADRSKGEADRSTAEANKAASSATQSQVSNQEAYKWAAESSRHSANSANSAAESKTHAVGAANSKTLSEQWARSPEDTVVQGIGYSSWHWSIKSNKYAQQSQVSNQESYNHSQVSLRHSQAAEVSRQAALVSEKNAKEWAAGVNLPPAAGMGDRYMKQSAGVNGLVYGRSEKELAWGTRFTENIAAGGAQHSIFSVMAQQLTGVYTAFIKGTSNGIVAAAQLMIVVTHPGRIKVSCMNSGFAKIDWKVTADNQGNSTVFVGLPDAVAGTPLDIVVFHTGNGGDSVRPGSNAVGVGGTEVAFSTGSYESYTSGLCRFPTGIDTETSNVKAASVNASVDVNAGRNVNSKGNVIADVELRGLTVRTTWSSFTKPVESPNTPKAMVVFDGTGKVLKQFGVASVVRVSAGQYRITWETPRPTADYFVSVSHFGAAVSGVSYGLGSMDVFAQTEAYTDVQYSVTGTATGGAAGNSRADSKKVFVAMYDF